MADRMPAPRGGIDLDVRSLRGWLTRTEDNDLELALRCDEGTADELTVTVGYGVGGSLDQAIAAAEAVGACFMDYADELRRQARAR